VDQDAPGRQQRRQRVEERLQLRLQRTVAPRSR
jgi:hypothetical protein